jgi:hypothetical protein
VTQILLPIAIGLILLGILLYWFLREAASDKRSLDSSEAHCALSYLQLRFLSVSLVDRILDHQDMIYVRGQKDFNLVRLLDVERRAIAILWLRQTRQQVRLLMSFHVKSARHSAKLGPAVESKLALHYFVFLMAYNALFALVWLRGPFHARKVAGFITIALKQFCTISHQALSIADVSHMRIPEGPGNLPQAGG